MYSEAVYGLDRVSVCALIAGCSNPPYVHLRNALGDVCSQTLEADRLADVGKILRHRKDISILFCGPELADARWQDVAALVHSPPQAPMLILAVRSPEAAIWTELLELG